MATYFARKAMRKAAKKPSGKLATRKSVRSMKKVLKKPNSSRTIKSTHSDKVSVKFKTKPSFIEVYTAINNRMANEFHRQEERNGSVAKRKHVYFPENEKKRPTEEPHFKCGICDAVKQAGCFEKKCDFCSKLVCKHCNDPYRNDPLWRFLVDNASSKDFQEDKETFTGLKETPPELSKCVMCEKTACFDCAAQMECHGCNKMQCIDYGCGDFLWCDTLNCNKAFCRECQPICGSCGIAGCGCLNMLMGGTLEHYCSDCMVARFGWNRDNMKDDTWNLFNGVKQNLWQVTPEDKTFMLSQLKKEATSVGRNKKLSPTKRRALVMKKSPAMKKSAPKKKAVMKRPSVMQTAAMKKAVTMKAMKRTVAVRKSGAMKKAAVMKKTGAKSTVMKTMKKAAAKGVMKKVMKVMKKAAGMKAMKK